MVDAGLFKRGAERWRKSEKPKKNRTGKPKTRADFGLFKRQLNRGRGPEKPEIGLKCRKPALA